MILGSMAYNIVANEINKNCAVDEISPIDFSFAVFGHVGKTCPNLVVCDQRYHARADYRAFNADVDPEAAEANTTERVVGQ